ncbi:hypothetical protein LSH36_41g11007 [Paralvinella palmiformis]|uniref:GDP-fucose pyrophosphorylase domain-containing protein n=1 Tax=Paralvinella palmiformis TaxID=53620 RepID=A0AAD9K815_9ANNE|nr:hypothetical protein LSH36_41g11007 [Paralvinella palmiformis]
MAGKIFGDIPTAVRKSYDNFCDIRGKEKDKFHTPFWDAVVLTTADDDQKVAFEHQIEQKLKRKEIPLGIPYLVFSDPPGPRAGCGTSLMNAICLLRELYGEKLDSYRILLISCGGQSQRLPSATILGKVFMALPMGSPPLSLFEYKLFSYLPLLERMNPGFLHVASDTIEVFDLGNEKSWSFEKPGFTAVAHPSSLEIGTTHGVFVLTQMIGGGQHITEMRDCLSVLQKPSVEKIRESHAVQKGMVNCSDKEFVYTDSFFYFDQQVAKKLETFYKAEEPLECEIDAYGDFFQSLGPEANIDFTRNLNNVSTVEPRLIEIREKIFYLLRGTPLNVMTLNCSKFYHLGTMREYINNFCVDETLKTQMGFASQTFCKFIPETPCDKSQQKMFCPLGCLIHSLLSEQSDIAQAAIVEFCNLPSEANIASNCILSNCSAKRDTIIYIPSNTFMHTVAIYLPSRKDTESRRVSYATVLFHVDDNIKKKVDHSSVLSVPYLDTSLGEYASMTSLTERDLFSEDCKTYSLWSARLFPVCSSMEKSFQCALDILSAIRDMKPFNLAGYRLTSMVDIVKYKDVASMLKYRQQLYEEISRQ